MAHILRVTRVCIDTTVAEHHRSQLTTRFETGRSGVDVMVGEKAPLSMVLVLNVYTITIRWFSSDHLPLVDADVGVHAG